MVEEEDDEVDEDDEDDMLSKCGINQDMTVCYHYLFL